MYNLRLARALKVLCFGLWWLVVFCGGLWCFVVFSATHREEEVTKEEEAFFPLLVLLLAALPLLPLENEKENGTSLKEEEETL